MEDPGTVRKRPRYLVLCVLVFMGALVAGGAWAAYVGLTRTVIGLLLLQKLISSERLTENLSSLDRDIVRESLGLLRMRKNPIAKNEARELLQSGDDYIWFNAALYLASIDDSDAIPWLIKGLKHPARNAHDEVASGLEALTGHGFGKDQDQWIAWWRSQKPGVVFNFAYEEGLTSGTTVLIDSALDPLTVTFMEDRIRLAGIKLKANVDREEATRFLNRLVEQQYFTLDMDAGPAEGDGARRSVLVSSHEQPEWAQPRDAAVPGGTTLSGYLLQTGNYEPDPGSVRDPRLRKIVEALKAR